MITANRVQEAVELPKGGFTEDDEALVDSNIAQWQRDKPFRLMAPDTAIRLSCEDCGMQKVETAGYFVRVRMGPHTINQMERSLKCHRPGCDGPIKLVIE